MAKLHKWARKNAIGQRFKRAVLGDATYDMMHPIGTAAVAAEEPAPAPPPAVPMPDEEDIRRAKRRSTTAQMQRAGRASTILSDSDRLGP